VRFVYDGDGNRVAKTVSGVTTKFLVDTNNPTGYAQVVEEIVNGVVNRVYVYGHMRVSQQQVISSNWVASFYGYDGHGSVRYLTDATGVISDSFTYDAFGVLINRTGTTPNDYLYAGEQFDSSLGFYYNRARYLNTTTGRFWTIDKYEGDLQSPPSLHKYLYASNDPVNKVDPSGYETLVGVLGGFPVRATINALSTLRNIAIAAAIVCTLDYAVTGLLNESGVNTGGSTPCDARNQENRVYRGTDITAENRAYEMTGHILSEAARRVFFETGNLALGYAKAAVTHQAWNALWGSEIFHAQEHGLRGTEMAREFGMDRTFVSVTRSLERARYFAGSTGKVYTAIVPRWEMVPQIIRGANEGEWLIRLGRTGFSEYK
jgi:RHS repeat-associated protein